MSRRFLFVMPKIIDNKYGRRVIIYIYMDKYHKLYDIIYIVHLVAAAAATSQYSRYGFK